MKSWKTIYHTGAGLCLLLLATTPYTQNVHASDFQTNTAPLEAGAVWLPHRAPYYLDTNKEQTLFTVNADSHQLPTEVLAQCGYKSISKPAAHTTPAQPQKASMHITTDPATGQALPWPGRKVTRNVKQHAVVYQTTSAPSFAFPRTESDPSQPPSCLYFFRLTHADTGYRANTERLTNTRLASQLVLKLTRAKGNIRYAPLYFALTAPLAAAVPTVSAPAPQKTNKIALMLNSSAMYRTASTTTHQFGYFQLPWALVIKNLELSPDAPCQITWHKASLHTSHCAKSDRLQVLMPTYPTQPLPQFERSFLLPQHGSNKPDQFPADPAPLPKTPPLPIVFAMLTTLESGFTPFWKENLESLTMLAGPDHTSQIFTQTLSFPDHGS
jgi:hypothetical protein